MLAAFAAEVAHAVFVGEVATVVPGVEVAWVAAATPLDGVAAAAAFAVDVTVGELVVAKPPSKPLTLASKNTSLASK